MRLSDPKNVKLFNEMKVYTPEECSARQDATLSHYTGTVEIEANCMVDMINQHVIPSCKEGNVGPVAKLEASVSTLKTALAAIHAAESSEDKARLARTLRLETMIDIRALCDEAESVCPASLWTLPSYTDLLFLDHNYNP